MVKVTGVMMEYYFVCKKKLWYFANQIQMENENENVLIGRMIDENSYIQEKRNILIDGTINIDFIKKYKQIHEVKKSKSIEEAAIWQVKYYLYYLKRLGIEEVTGIIDYPLLRKNLVVKLEENDEEKIEKIIRDIVEIVTNPSPPSVNRMKICKNCAYYELCFV
ncbi:CRISPR-associated protein Cas4 [Thermoclostridium stercorarium subsp. thermolacticum DSM 2910]|jgi:CRISPR-associated exonuclease Cas4|nr:CRISPR-associated protein Cas4 [Thermoclostridium stercorarium]AGI39648.1 CRISPR protein [Thermoclostridium stercorarium subsp. stercorarium DSM 8532]ANW98979.1 CRISPR-associated protein Cas4 [Thermoclostridium stercorarium subsp. thermolacticum DSM 2910]ANX01506.1 CRISPR-associated protein Cas4 [Thermoclostridium stercorarium subsp. leptospartum DSM 9219]UZQ84620.1 CRISPR-associated protein Cas4 [Thermoclostridium stercorarium]